MARYSFGIVAFGFVALLGAACAQAIGIEDATVDPTFNPATPGLDPVCEEYCDLLEAGCVEGNIQYVSRRACRDVCAALPRGEDGDTIGNTLHCRLTNARGVASEPDFQCSIAGPAGVTQDNTGCGAICEGYCSLMESICRPEFDILFRSAAECLSVCEGYGRVVDESFSATFTQGDTVECRIYHLGAAGEFPSVHCEHAQGVAECVDMGTGGGGGSGGSGSGGSGGN